MSTANQITDDQLVAKFIELRAQKAAAEEAHKLATAPLTENMQFISGLMGARLAERGATSVKTEHGTAYKSENMKPKVADRQAFLDFILHHPDEWLQMLDAGVLIEPLREYMAQNGGMLPPGIDVTMVVSTNFRKA